MWVHIRNRRSKHYEFCQPKNFVGKKEGAVRYWDKSTNDKEDTLLDENEKPDEQHNDKVPWNKGTILVMGDSTLNGIQEKLMGPRFKVRAFPGAIVRDFYRHAITLLKKIPTSVDIIWLEPMMQL